MFKSLIKKFIGFFMEETAAATVVVQPNILEEFNSFMDKLPTMTETEMEAAQAKIDSWFAMQLVNVTTEEQAEIDSWFE